MVELFVGLERLSSGTPAPRRLLPGSRTYHEALPVHRCVAVGCASYLLVLLLALVHVIGCKGINKSGIGSHFLQRKGLENFMVYVVVCWH